MFTVLAEALRRAGPVPVLLERDHGLEDGLAPLLEEVARVRRIGAEVFGEGGAAGMDPQEPVLVGPSGPQDVRVDPPDAGGSDALLDALLDPGAPAGAAELLPPERLAVYTELVARNLEAVLANALPLTGKRLGEAAFEALVARFLAEVGPQHPWHREVPGDFVVWAEASGHPLAQLMRWEWLELVALWHPADVHAWRRAATCCDAVSPNPTLQALLAPMTLDVLDGHVPDGPIEAGSYEAVYLVWRDVDDLPRFQRVDLATGQALALAAEAPATVHTLARSLAAHHGLDSLTLERHLGGTLGSLIARGGALGRAGSQGVREGRPCLTLSRRISRSPGASPEVTKRPSSR